MGINRLWQQVQQGGVPPQKCVALEKLFLFVLLHPMLAYRSNVVGSCRNYFLLTLYFLVVRSAALGRVWPENGRAGGGRRLVTASGVVRAPKGGAVHRIPRFPPLADQV